MKNLFKSLSLTVTLLLFYVITFAQDSVKVVGDTTRAVIDSTAAAVGKQVLGIAESHWIWLAGVLGFIVLLDHILASIPSVKANSTFQLISGWIAALTGGSKNA